MDWRLMGAQIKKARENKGYTQEQLAERLNLSVQHISVLERGVKAPKMETFVNIANELGVDANFLLGDLLDVSPQIMSNGLYNELDDLSARDKKRILKVLSVLIETIID